MHRARCIALTAGTKAAATKSNSELYFRLFCLSFLQILGSFRTRTTSSLLFRGTPCSRRAFSRRHLDIATFGSLFWRGMSVFSEKLESTSSRICQTERLQPIAYFMSLNLNYVRSRLRIRHQYKLQEILDILSRGHESFGMHWLAIPAIRFLDRARDIWVIEVLPFRLQDLGWFEDERLGLLCCLLRRPMCRL